MALIRDLMALLLASESFRVLLISAAVIFIFFGIRSLVGAKKEASSSDEYDPNADVPVGSIDMGAFEQKKPMIGNNWAKLATEPLNSPLNAKRLAPATKNVLDSETKMVKAKIPAPPTLLSQRSDFEHYYQRGWGALLSGVFLLSFPGCAHRGVDRVCINARNAARCRVA